MADDDKAPSFGEGLLEGLREAPAGPDEPR